MTSPKCKIVLYVEDNDVNSFLVEAIFASRPDIRIVSAPNGEKGLALAHEFQPDLILLDLNLPDMRGEQFIEAKKCIPSIAPVPVIILSADAAFDPSGSLADQSIVDFIGKPFDIDHLENTVDRWLGRKP